MPKVIFANFINNLMTTYRYDSHAIGLSLVSPRKTWLAENGDIVVTSRKINDDFKDYALNLISVDKKKVSYIDLESYRKNYLTDNLYQSEIINDIKQVLNPKKEYKIYAFATDSYALKLSENLGIDLIWYKGKVSSSVEKFIYDVNTKAVFRKICKNLGIPITPGFYCSGYEDLNSTIIKAKKELGKSDSQA